MSIIRRNLTKSFKTRQYKFNGDGILNEISYILGYYFKLMAKNPSELGSYFEEKRNPGSLDPLILFTYCLLRREVIYILILSLLVLTSSILTKILIQIEV